MGDCEYESDFWEWLDEGMSGQRDEDHEPVQGFVWDGAGPTMHGETVAQQKTMHGETVAQQKQ